VAFGLFEWQAGIKGLSFGKAEWSEIANRILTKSIQRNIYSVSQIDFHDILSERREFPLPQETNNINFSFADLKENNLLVAMEDSFAYINGENSNNTEVDVVLKSDKKTYIFNTLKQRRPDVTALFKKTLNFDDSGFAALILKKGLERGVYKIGLYIRKNNIGALQYSNKMVTVS